MNDASETPLTDELGRVTRERDEAEFQVRKAVEAAERAAAERDALAARVAEFEAECESL